MKLSTTFAALYSISTAVAQTTPDDESMLLIQSLGLKDELPKPGYNMEGGSVFDNYVKAQRDGQFFLFVEGIFQYEEPSSTLVEGAYIRWCSNLHFTGSNGTYSRGVGYTAQCLQAYLGDLVAKFDASSAQQPHALVADEFAASMMLSASYNTQANMFNLANHKNTDNFVFLYSDTGVPTMPAIVWENHDEGDLHPNAETSSLSGTGQATWVSTEEAARILNNNATDFTSEMFDKIYEKVWNDNHDATDTDESTNKEEEGEEPTATDTIETDESNGNDENSVATEEGSESDIEEDDESSASNGRRLFVVVTSMLSTLLGSSI